MYFVGNYDTRGNWHGVMFFPSLHLNLCQHVTLYSTLHLVIRLLFLLYLSCKSRFAAQSVTEYIWCLSTQTILKCCFPSLVYLTDKFDNEKLNFYWAQHKPWEQLSSINPFTPYSLDKHPNKLDLDYPQVILGQFGADVSPAYPSFTHGCPPSLACLGRHHRTAFERDSV